MNAPGNGREERALTGSLGWCATPRGQRMCALHSAFTGAPRDATARAEERVRERPGRKTAGRSIDVASLATGADVRVVPRLLESEGSRRALLGRYHSGIYRH